MMIVTVKLFGAGIAILSKERIRRPGPLKKALNTLDGVDSVEATNYRLFVDGADHIIDQEELLRGVYESLLTEGAIRDAAKQVFGGNFVVVHEPEEPEKPQSMYQPAYWSSGSTISTYPQLVQLGVAPNTTVTYPSTTTGTP